jgi:hypothetical protein
MDDKEKIKLLEKQIELLEKVVELQKQVRPVTIYPTYPNFPAYPRDPVYPTWTQVWYSTTVSGGAMC